MASSSYPIPQDQFGQSNQNPFQPQPPFEQPPQPQDLQQDQPGLEFILTDEIQNTEFGNDPNMTANDRIEKGLNMMASYSGSIYFWSTKKHGWSHRYGYYSAEVFYVYKSFSSSNPLLQFNCKRQSVTQVDEPIQLNEDGLRKCIVIGPAFSETDPYSAKEEKTSEQIYKLLGNPELRSNSDFRSRTLFDVGIPTESTTSSSEDPSSSNSNTIDPALVVFSNRLDKSICFEPLTVDDTRMWYDSLTTQDKVEQKVVPIWPPDPLYRVLHISYFADHIASSNRLQQESRIAIIKRQIQAMENWIKQLKQTDTDFSSHSLRLRDLKEQLEIALYAKAHPSSPVDKTKYDIDLVKKTLYMKELAEKKVNQEVVQAQLEQEQRALSRIRTLPEGAAAAQFLSEEMVRSALERGTKEKEFSSIMREFTNLLNPNDLQIDWNHVLDTTAFATIHPGTLRVSQTTIDVLVKAPNKGIEMNFARRQSLLREMITLRQIQHPNLIQFYGSVELDGGRFGIVTERVAGEDLTSILTKHKIPEHRATILLTGVASGMVYLHDVKQIKHRDLNPRNIVISAVGTQLTAKISDFGMVSTPAPKSEGANQTSRPYYGAPAYSAPELPDLDHTPAVDVFSFAYVMWQMHYRKTPFVTTGQTTNMMNHLDQVRYNNKREQLGPECIWYPLIERCWQTEPKDRPKFKEILFHLQFLESIFVDDNQVPTDPADPKSKLDPKQFQQWVKMVSGEGGDRIPTHEDIQSLLPFMIVS